MHCTNATGERDTGTEFGQSHIDAVELSASLAKRITAPSRILLWRNFIARRFASELYADAVEWIASSKGH
jgi:hypothetical protein